MVTMLRRVANQLLIGVALTTTVAGHSAHASGLPTDVASVAQQVTEQTPPSTPSSVAPSVDVDALLSHMSLNAKVGQLFMLGFQGGDPAGALPILAELRAGGVVLTTNVSDAISAQQLTSALQVRQRGMAFCLF
ncbi:MAG: hypothetical protein JO352_12580 [Chloroflexi bacterium]|nr:hypothetical protein [Chloroflexota bacterium]MBV9599853.1 hypothetical protein [Chloroflexota bacterium]